MKGNATITLNIDGMTGGCVKSVTRLLEGVEGVEKQKSAWKTKNAVITSMKARQMPTLIDAVEDGGYDVAL